MSETVTIKTKTKKGIKIIAKASFDPKKDTLATLADMAAYRAYVGSDEYKAAEKATESERLNALANREAALEEAQAALAAAQKEHEHAQIKAGKKS